MTPTCPAQAPPSRWTRPLIPGQNPSAPPHIPSSRVWFQHGPQSAQTPPTRQEEGHLGRERGSLRDDACIEDQGFQRREGFPLLLPLPSAHPLSAPPPTPHWLPEHSHPPPRPHPFPQMGRIPQVGARDCPRHVWLSSWRAAVLWPTDIPPAGEPPVPPELPVPPLPADQSLPASPLIPSVPRPFSSFFAFLLLTPPPSPSLSLFLLCTPSHNPLHPTT